jgi:D-beta-D-heptose 7-phosphate kinase/D-beta-D-heptose 1-phosphate adenosyltransferase
LKDFSSIQPQQKYKILLVGDIGEDIYTYGNVNRISPEAPVPVFEPKYVVTKAGMAGNVAKNLEALGCHVNFLHGNTSVKNRLIDIRSKQQLIRLDTDVVSEPIRFETALPAYDAVVISDYNKGTVDYDLITDLIKTVTVPIFLDTKKTNLAQLNGCYIKINSLENSRAISRPHPQWLITTQGDQGAAWNGQLFPSESAGNVTDVCGAGDTFLSALVYKFLETSSIADAIKFANKAAAVTVQHVGVYAPTLEEII